VEALGQLAISGLDFLIAALAADTQNFVVVSL
jgi:hypothetical protein